MFKFKINFQRYPIYGFYFLNVLHENKPSTSRRKRTSSGTHEIPLLRRPLSRLREKRRRKASTYLGRYTNLQFVSGRHLSTRICPFC